MRRTKTYSVYIVQCSDGTLYTGVAKDLEKRIEVHNQGKGAKYTRARLPVKLVYSVSRLSQSQALKKEWSIKQLSRVQKQKLIRRKKNFKKRGPH